MLLLLCATGSDVSHVTGSDHITGSDVISPRFFLIIVVLQNVPLLFIIRFTVSDYSFGIFWSLCCLSFDWRLLIIRLVSSSFPCKGTFCSTTIIRKMRGKIASLPVIWALPVTWLTSLLVMTSLPVARSSSSSSSNTHRVMMTNPIIFWKPIIRFFMFFFRTSIL